MNHFYWNDATQQTRDISKPFLEIGYLVWVDGMLGPQFNARLPFTGICPCNLKIDWGNLSNPYIINIPKGTNITEQLIAHNFDWHKYLNGNEEYSFIVKIYSDNDWMPDWIGGGGQITSIHGSFLKCNNLISPFYSSLLKSIDVKIFDIIGSSITKMNYFFGRCIYFDRDGNEHSRLSTIPAGIFDKLVNCTDFSNCFNGSSITSIPTNLFKYNTKVTNFSGCFANSSITTLPTDIFRYNTQVTNFSSCFENSLITKFSNNLFKYNINASNFNSCFKDCPSLFSPGNLISVNYLFGNWQDYFTGYYDEYDNEIRAYNHPNFRGKQMDFRNMFSWEKSLTDYENVSREYTYLDYMVYNTYDITPLTSGCFRNYAISEYMDFLMYEFPQWC